MTKNNTNFIAGNIPTIADLLYFYELSNLVYFKVSQERYKSINDWYKRIYSIPEVKNIMQEWEPFAKERA
jgi:glutathione S-transferase